MTEKPKKARGPNEMLYDVVVSLYYKQPYRTWPLLEELQQHLAAVTRRVPAPLVHAEKLIKERVAEGQLQELLNRDAQELAYIEKPAIPLTQIQVSDSAAKQLSEFIQEYRCRDQFPVGFPIRNKLLLYGAPGVGKSMAAAVVATELGLPLIHVPVTGLLDSLLGGSSKHINTIFKQMRTLRGVYLLDELDALGGARGGDRSSDRENSRIVISLLRGLDSMLYSDNILIGTTNLMKSLDKAVLRRFNSHLHLTMPTPDVATRIVTIELEKFNYQLSAEQLAWALENCNRLPLVPSRLVEATHTAIRQHVVSGQPLEVGLFDALQATLGD